MKKKALLKILNDYLNADHKEQLEKYKSIKSILKKLKKKELKLKLKLESTFDKAQQDQLKKELHILFIQRKKGIDLKKKLKNERNKDTSEISNKP